MRRELDMVGYHGRGGRSALADPVVGSEKVTIDRPKRKKCEGSGSRPVWKIPRFLKRFACAWCNRTWQAYGLILDDQAISVPIHYRPVTTTSEEAAR